MSKDNIEDFPFPLDTDVEETVPVQKNSFNPDTGRVTSTYQLEKVKTRYIHAPKEKLRCKPGDHIFRVLDNRKWIFGCTICPFAKKVSPATFTFNKGKLISKATELPV